MRALVALSLAVAGAFAPATAGGGQLSGMLIAGHPGTRVGAGVTELLGACDASTLLQGLDGYWVLIDGATHASVEPTANAVISNFDVAFYDAECTYLNGTDLDSGGPGEAEAGPVPLTAWYLIVTSTSGVGIGFDLTLT